MTWKACLWVMAMALAASAAEAAQPKDAASPTAAPPAAKKRQRVVSDLSGFELLDPEKLKDKPTVGGATRSLFPKPPVLLAPYVGKLHGARPIFAWRHTGKRFAFALSEAGRELHKAEVEGHRYALPAKGPKLLDGKTYTWSVTPLEPAAPAAAADIVVVTKAERTALDAALAGAQLQDEYTTGLGRGAAFTETRVWYDALGTYSDLIERFPERTEAYGRRAELYAQIPALKDAAEEDFARAEK